MLFQRAACLSPSTTSRYAGAVTVAYGLQHEISMSLAALERLFHAEHPNLTVPDANSWNRFRVFRDGWEIGTFSDFRNRIRDRASRSEVTSAPLSRETSEVALPQTRDQPPESRFLTIAPHPDSATYFETPGASHIPPPKEGPALRAGGSARSSKRENADSHHPSDQPYRAPGFPPPNRLSQGQPQIPLPLPMPPVQKLLATAPTAPYPSESEEQQQRRLQTQTQDAQQPYHPSYETSTASKPTPAVPIPHKIDETAYGPSYGAQRACSSADYHAYYGGGMAAAHPGAGWYWRPYEAPQGAYQSHQMVYTYGDGIYGPYSQPTYPSSERPASDPRWQGEPDSNKPL